jgi:hypothetical protein
MKHVQKQIAIFRTITWLLVLLLALGLCTAVGRVAQVKETGKLESSTKQKAKCKKDGVIELHFLLSATLSFKYNHIFE